MTPQELDAWLARSLDDRLFSRGERQDLGRHLSEAGVDREAIRRRAFEAAGAALGRVEDRAVLDWLEGVIRASREETSAGVGRGLAEAHFSPGEDCLQAIGRLIARASKTVDVCVFTITDDRLSAALLDAHRRKVSVRILTDDMKAEDLGSDVAEFERVGIPVRVDRSPFHMHHKFAILDGRALLTGSYNWTRGAARDNQENLIVTDDPRLVAPFARTFESLWERMGR